MVIVHNNHTAAKAPTKAPGRKGALYRWRRWWSARERSAGALWKAHVAKPVGIIVESVKAPKVCDWASVSATYMLTVLDHLDLSNFIVCLFACFEQTLLLDFMLRKKRREGGQIETE